MIVMPANSTGSFWTPLARETGRLGHLYSPGGQRGPWPWFPYALDNGAFACWNRKGNIFNHAKWSVVEHAWRSLLFWSQATGTPALWAIVPDVPGNGEATLERWAAYAPIVADARIPLAIAVQDEMTADDVKALHPQPEVICIGGGDEFKWGTVEAWCREFPRVHLLRCNMPDRLDWLESIGVESTDGTGWCRGNRVQTAGIEAWCRARAVPNFEPLWPHVCRAPRDPEQMTFA